MMSNRSVMSSVLGAAHILTPRYISNCFAYAGMHMAFFCMPVGIYIWTISFLLQYYFPAAFDFSAMTKTVYGSFSPVLSEGRKYKRHTKGTYIGLVAYVIQDSPNKMLTFKQIMKKLEMFVSGDRKGLENNIRVCLSSNKCFVKVPVDPEYPNAKRNFWRVDESNITPKMLRRHFSDMSELFPGLPPTWNRKASHSPVPVSPDCHPKIGGHPGKFTGPFSIESLLQKDHVPQTRVAMQQSAQTSSTNLCRSDQLYAKTASTQSPTCLDRENRQHSLYYIYRSIEDASWAHVQRMDLSPDLHHPLLYSPNLSYDQTTPTSMWNSSPNTHELAYRMW